TVKEVKTKVGDKISQGDLILLLETEENATTAAPAPTPKPAVAQAPAATAPADSPAEPGYGGGASADTATATAPTATATAPTATATAPASAPPAAAPSGSQIQEVRVPDIGDFKDVGIIEVMVTPGDTLEVEQPMIILESDKASMEVPAPEAGVVKEVKVKVGDKVSRGDLILLLETEAAPAAVVAAPISTPPPVVALGPTAQKPASFEARPPVTSMPPVDEAAFAKVHASPSVRLFARELGVDLGRIKEGSGRKGRISREDVQNFVKRLMAGEQAPAAETVAGTGIPPIPPVDFAKFGEIETVPVGRIKRLSAVNLSRSWLNLPHVTHHDEADITETEAFRKSLTAEAEKEDIRITLLSFLLKAAAVTLKAFPTFNASLDPSGENLILKKYVHIGVAVDTPEGLVVPVIRDVDRKTIFELSRDLSDYSAKARAKKLTPNEMQGAGFTISSLGGIGGKFFTPIINAPEVAILGITRSYTAPVWDGKEFQPRLLLPLSLSYDHRVIDGAQAARFMNHFRGLIGDIRRLLL
ncbi:MAG TPA: dihydrolipoyllysine-residue acetyltransferase, partial [Candidatus Competibacteraceae bacterium]|nr:dihydrolipoyllysine-residue acetyltransferase [Candidatus Competibacteraceae bacterium]